MNHCDHGHETRHPVKLYPTGGGGNMIVCFGHFLTENQYNLDRGESWDTLPSWKSLKDYVAE